MSSSFPFLSLWTIPIYLVKCAKPNQPPTTQHRHSHTVRQRRNGDGQQSADTDAPPRCHAPPSRPEPPPEPTRTVCNTPDEKQKHPPPKIESGRSNPMCYMRLAMADDNSLTGTPYSLSLSRSPFKSASTTSAMARIVSNTAGDTL